MYRTTILFPKGVKLVIHIKALVHKRSPLLNFVRMYEVQIFQLFIF